MPDQVPAPAPSPVSPGSPASPGVASPVGTTPVTQSVPNRGFEMAGMQGLGTVLKQLETLVPMLGASSEAGKDVLKCINMISKHVQPGAVSPAAQRNQLMAQMQRMRQNVPGQKPAAPPAPQPAPGGAMAA